MEIKIERVLVENFKLFHKLLVDFSSTNFIVFDGPNGYGKTSFYDALELFFTGKIRRYDEWVKIVTDGRETFKENPYLNSRSKEGDLVIKVELKIGGRVKVLMRRGKRNELNSTTKISDMEFDLIELNNFDDIDGSVIEDETVYMENLLGENYYENFQFLHYIEQEENITLLKNKDRDRKNAIDYLFNTVDFQRDLDRLKEILSKTTELCGSAEATKLSTLKKEIDELKNEITKDVEQVEYSRLLEWKDFEWDKEEISFKEGQYSDLVGGEGILEKIKQLKTNIGEFSKRRDNDYIDGIARQTTLLTQLVRYYKHLDDVSVYTQKRGVQREIAKIKKEYSKGTLKAVIDDQIELGPVKDVVGDQIDLEKYEQSKKEISQLYQNLNIFSAAVSSLRESRSMFSENFKKFEEISGLQKECPMCGFDWETAEKLKQNLTKQEKKVEDLAKESDQHLLDAIKQFEKTFVDKLQEIFNEYLSNNKVDEVFIDGLQEAAQNKELLKKLYRDLERINVKVEDCLIDKKGDDFKAKLEHLISKLEGSKKDLDQNKLQV